MAANHIRERGKRNYIRKRGKHVVTAGSDGDHVILDANKMVQAAPPNTNGRDQPPPLLTEFDLAAYLQLSIRTIQRWRRSGDGPRFIKLRAMVRYRLEDVATWCAEQTKSSTAG